MRLVSILNVWADTLELLSKCIENKLKFSDVIVIWSSKSNRGESDHGSMLTFIATHHFERTTFSQLEPIEGKPVMNETRKRNAGIEIAKKQGYTHYLICDADEFYLPEEIENDKKLFSDPDLVGLVSPLRVYIKSPTLWCNDRTLVPIIHKLKKDSYVGKFLEYPFAQDAGGGPQIDPTRRPNELTGIKMSDTVMHHYSYVRIYIDKKIKNSTANLPNRRDRILRDIALAKPGYRSELYDDVLKESPNYFGL